MREKERAKKRGREKEREKKEGTERVIFTTAAEEVFKIHYRLIIHSFIAFKETL